jgi:uncharacterized protein involved in exopolysaccharide biosynthesis/Mrp family chromosome partitioning ATPase
MSAADSIFTLDPPRDEGLPFTSRDVLRIFFKHRTLILTCFAVFTSIVVLGLCLIPLSYEAGAKVMVKTELQVTPSFFSGIAAYRDQPLADPAGRRIETEMELLETEPLSEHVVKALRLEYGQVYHKPYVHVLNRVTDILDVPLAFVGYPPDPEKYGFRPTVEAFQQSLIVKPIKSKSAEANSNLIEIRLKAPTAETAHLGLDALLAAYTKYDITVNQRAGETAHRIVKLQLDETYAKVKAAQARLRAFLLARTEHKGTVLPESVSVNSGGREGVEDGLVTSPRDQTSLSILKSKLIELEMERLDAEKTFQGESDRAEMLGRTIKALQSRVSKELKNDAENHVTLANLERDVRTIDTEYIEINNRLTQIDLFLKVNEQQFSNRIVVEPPVRPRTSDRKRQILLGVFSSFGGLLLGVGLAALREYGDHTLRTAADVRRFLRLDVLASLPMVPPAVVAAVGRPETDAGAEARELSLLFNRLAQRVALLVSGRAGAATGVPTSVLVTSVQTGEGKSTVSRGLASCLAAQSGQRVLLVLADAADAEPKETDTLAGALRSGVFPRRFVSSPQAGLSVLPAGSLDIDVLFKAKAWTAFLAAAGEAFDFVVIDGASLSSLGANALPYVVDALLLVVDSESCRREVARSVLGPLEVPPSKWLGAVLNKKVRHIPDALYRRF